MTDAPGDCGRAGQGPARLWVVLVAELVAAEDALVALRQQVQLRCFEVETYAEALAAQDRLRAAQEACALRDVLILLLAFPPEVADTSRIATPPETVQEPDMDDPVNPAHYGSDGHSAQSALCWL